MSPVRQYLVATKVDAVYEVELPSSVRAVLNTFSVGVSFGVSDLGSVLECLDFRGYLATLLVYMVLPPIVAVIIVLIGMGRLRYAKERSAEAFVELTVPFLLQLLFLAYPLVTNVVCDAAF